MLNACIALRRVCQAGQELNLKYLEECLEVVRSLLYLEITDWESVKISTIELCGTVDMAERIARSSALYDEGQLYACAANWWVI
jgi:hypothetical protein